MKLEVGFKWHEPEVHMMNLVVQPTQLGRIRQQQEMDEELKIDHRKVGS